MPDLDEQLTAGRQRVLDAIEQPPFEPIARRAGALRRRRALARVGTAAATAVLVGTAAVTALVNREPAPPPMADASASPGAIYSVDGITINGLPALPAELPGNVVDVEFVDAERGYLLTAACDGGCKYTFASTTDGGRAWKVAPLPGGLGSAPPLLVPLGDHAVVVPTPTGADQAEPATELPGFARLQLVPPGACGGTVDAWVPRGDGAALVAPVRQPDLTVCWTSPVRAGDGAWWVGGVQNGAAAVAVSRDGGRTWTTTRLGDTGAGARVAMLGQDVYATVLGPSDELLAVYHSGDGGRTFNGITHRGMPAKIGGELVPLYDGRLLLVNGDGMGGWFLSRDKGATWTAAAGLHPTERIARTSGGYVAYKMTTIYTAFSVDGSTWRKVNAR